VLGFDDRGKVKLSMRQVDQQTGEDLGSRRQDARQPEPATAPAAK
jgi:polyribonucleotide nucleotidyltransferase